MVLESHSGAYGDMRDDIFELGLKTTFKMYTNCHIDLRVYKLFTQ